MCSPLHCRPFKQELEQIYHRQTSITCLCNPFGHLCFISSKKDRFCGTEAVFVLFLSNSVYCLKEETNFEQRSCFYLLLLGDKDLQKCKLGADETKLQQKFN